MRHSPRQQIPASGPTPERLKQSGGFFEIGGNKRDGHRFKMLEDPLGRALVRQKISPEEFHGLRRYAHHWASGGLQGHVGSVDMNRIYAFDPAAMSAGLAHSEAQVYHRQAYCEARAHIGRRPAFVADCVACCELTLEIVGDALGFRSPYRGRTRALEILRDAGDRLATYWRNQ